AGGGDDQREFYEGVGVFFQRVGGALRGAHGRRAGDGPVRLQGKPSRGPRSSDERFFPARIRNTAVGIESYASLVSSDADSTLSRNVMTCSADPCGVSSSS
ncbi:unnamed protein product, partial [Ectocarpus sp. 12 AP-2014]